MRLENKKEALTIGSIGIAAICLSLLVGCGKESKVMIVKGDTGAKGDTGEQGYGAGVLAEAISALCGATDGVRITTFQDKNNNGLMESGESVNAVTTVCNGSNGTNGANGQNGTSSTVSIANVAPSCFEGGYTMTVMNGPVSSSYPICNGLQGVQGPRGQQGLQGNQGIPGTNGANGLNGTNGTVVTPVKFCASDNSSYPEYGLYIDGRLFAVYWGDTPGSNGNQEQAFLTEILPVTIPLLAAITAHLRLLQTVLFNKFSREPSARLLPLAP